MKPIRGLLIGMRVAMGLQVAVGIALWTGHLYWLVNLHMAIGSLFVLMLWAIAALAIARHQSVGLAMFAIVWESRCLRSSCRAICTGSFALCTSPSDSRRCPSRSGSRAVSRGQRSSRPDIAYVTAERADRLGVA